MEEEKQVIELPENRVRRNYRGGKGIDLLRRKASASDGERPEEWIASLVEANNPGLDPIPGEGLTRLLSGRYLSALIDRDPAYYLGERFTKRGKRDFGFLVKILDSSMRLHIQAHPTAEFAKKYLNSDYGKLECYIILGSRKEVDPYIYLGFNEEISKDAWKHIIEEQDLDKMERLMVKVPVKTGEVWMIPGGVPHAIGEGITMVEVMEPSDLVVRCEFTREGIVVPEEARFMGKGLAFCLDIFDYRAYTPHEVKERFCITPETVRLDASVKIEHLIGPGQTNCFRIDRLTLQAGGTFTYKKPDTPQILIVLEGGLDVPGGDENRSFGRGESFLIPAGIGELPLSGIGGEAAVVAIISSN